MKMKMNDFSQDSGKVSIGLPPIINAELAKSLTTTTEAGGSMVNSMSSGNFVLSLVMGGSMQQLWGMIRAMQFIILCFLIKVPTPGHTHKFFEGCAAFAQMDILDGKTLYEKMFEFKET
jgi:hypothetical protein